MWLRVDRDPLLPEGGNNWWKMTWSGTFLFDEGAIPCGRHPSCAKRTVASHTSSAIVGLKASNPPYILQVHTKLTARARSYLSWRPRQKIATEDARVFMPRSNRIYGMAVCRNSSGWRSSCATTADEGRIHEPREHARRLDTACPSHSDGTPNHHPNTSHLNTSGCICAVCTPRLSSTLARLDRMVSCLQAAVAGTALVAALHRKVE